MDYRKGIRATLWIAAICGALCGLALALWGTLSLAGDQSGAVVARVLALVCGIAASGALVILLVLLARIQLDVLEGRDPKNSRTSSD